MKLWPVVTGVAIALTLVACKSPTPPKGVQPISGFDASRYLGKWYEVARLENRFERGLEQVTATYGARSDGGISVVNRGYDPVKKRWNESDGKAYFTGAPTTAALKVSFFGPFYGGYNVIRPRTTTTSTRWSAAPTATICGSCRAPPPFRRR